MPGGCHCHPQKRSRVNQVVAPAIGAFPDYVPGMTPFGLRKLLKGAVKTALGMDPPSAKPTTPPPPPARPPAPKKAAAAPAPPRPSHGAPSKAKANPNLPPGTMWVQGARMNEILPDTCKVVTVLGRKVALYQVDGELFATDNACPHAKGQLGEGDLEGHTITCPFHAFKYDVRTGECVEGTADAVETIRVKVDGNLVLFEV